MRSLAFAALLVSFVTGCPRRAERRPDSGAQVQPWPALPRDPTATRRLVQRLTRRKLDVDSPRPPDSSAALFDLLWRRQRQGRLVAGWPAVIRTLQAELQRSRSSVLLVGTYHDAGGQVAAFGRLIGPSGLRGLGAAAVELLPADGHWREVPSKQQRGLSRQVALYLKRGQRAALDEVQVALPRVNYTAWKYRYRHRVLDLLVSARAAGLELVPCDMPRQLQQSASGCGPLIDRVRELHCLLALRDVLGREPRRLALLWGQAHLRPDAMPRFFPSATRVVTVHLYGHRPGPAGLEHALAGRLRLTDPLLVPLGEAPDLPRFMLLLDGPQLAARVLRARDPLERPLPAERRHRLQVAVEQATQLELGGQQLELEAGASREVALAPGNHTFLAQSGNRLLGGAISVPRQGAVTLTLRPGGVQLVAQIVER